MIRKMATYKVDSGKVETVRAAVTEFVNAIAQHEPASSYSAYQAEDGVSFVHIMTFPDEAAEQAHRSAPHTEAFVEALYPNCEIPPAFANLELVVSTEG